MKNKAKIIGTGSYLPEQVLSNQDLEKMVDTSDEWITSRTGMKERRIARADEYSSTMGSKAAREALSSAGISADQIDFIIVATLTPDYTFPATACLIQEEIGATAAAAVDIQAACTGFLYALSIAKGWIESGMYKNILVVASDKVSSITNYKDRSTCILFGDGAAACVVSAEGKGLIIEKVCLGSEGSQANLLIMPAGGCRNPASVHSVTNDQHTIQMDGNKVFKNAVRQMETASKNCLIAAQIDEREVSWVIPHQANIRIIDAVAKRFDHLSPDRIFKTVHKYGNTSGSSVGIALDELLKGNLTASGEKILLIAFGAGFTWGAAVLHYE